MNFDPKKKVGWNIMNEVIYLGDRVCLRSCKVLLCKYKIGNENEFTKKKMEKGMNLGFTVRSVFSAYHGNSSERFSGVGDINEEKTCYKRQCKSFKLWYNFSD